MGSGTVTAGPSDGQASRSRTTNDWAPTRRRLVVASLILLGLAATAVWPALTGDFVYDDHRQIVDNHELDDPARLVAALGSDVWSFNTDFRVARER